MNKIKSEYSITIHIFEKHSWKMTITVLYYHVEFESLKIPPRGLRKSYARVSQEHQIRKEEQ